VAILYPGNQEARQNATSGNNRFAGLFRAFAARGIPAEPAVYYTEFRPLKQKLEQQWVPAVQRLLEIETESLPILWDCDFLLGPKGDDGEDTYVLCEINVSSVAPYPESAVPYICDATEVRLKAAGQRRGLGP
jgi:hypothetical protein